MIKRLFLTLAVLVSVVALGSPARADVPAGQSIVWEGKSLADQLSTQTVLDSPEDLAYAHLLPATPAAAEARAATLCPGPDVVCLWNGYSYTGTQWTFPWQWMWNGYPQENGLSLNGSAINNASKGWRVNTSIYIRLFDRDDCQNSGWYRDMAPYSWAVQDTAADADWENRISSLSWTARAGNYCFSDPYS